MITKKNGKYRKKRLLTLLFALAGSAAAAGGFSSLQGQVLDTYVGGLSPHWKSNKFAGVTRYAVVEEDGRLAIRAESRAAASGLYYEIDYDPAEYPVLRWEWKVANIIGKGDARTKAGDDYAARVYVVFPSFWFWRTRALNYIWANKLPEGEAVPSAYTDNSMMIAVESGTAHIGQWRREERNVYEDYQRLFGEKPPRAGAIAIMTDTDNTGESALAWYGTIAIGKIAP